MVTAILRHGLLDSARGRCRILLRLIADRRKLHGPSARVGRRRLGAVSGGLINSSILRSCGSLALTLFLSLALLLLLLLPSLPFFADLLEFCNATTWSVLSGPNKNLSRIWAKDPAVWFGATR